MFFSPAHKQSYCVSIHIAGSAQLCHHICFCWNSGFTIVSMSHRAVSFRSFVIGLSTRVYFLILVCLQSSASPTKALKNVFHCKHVFYPLVSICLHSLLSRSLCANGGDVLFLSCEHLPVRKWAKTINSFHKGQQTAVKWQWYKLYNSNQNSCETAQKWFWRRGGEKRKKVIWAAVLEKEQLCQQKEQFIGYERFEQ